MSFSHRPGIATIAFACALSAMVPNLLTDHGSAQAQSTAQRSVWISRTSSAPAAVSSGEIKGTITIQTADGKSFDLASYSNAPYDGSTNSSNAPKQCPELIVRYAGALGYGSGSVGNGKDAAQGFASRSRGQFVFNANRQSADLPVPGAVISISGYDQSGAEFAGGYGHVGIVQKVSVSGTTAEVTLFDQNWPTSFWKTVSFQMENGSWRGTFRNTPKGSPTQIIDVAGWANPAARSAPRSTTVAPSRSGSNPESSSTSRRNDTESPAPATPRNLTPGRSSSPGVTLAGSSVTLAWARSSGAVEYRLSVRDMSTRKSVFSERISRTYQIIQVESGHTYRWSVRACNDSGCSESSEDLYFTAK